MKIAEHVSIAPYTTFHVGGPARFFCVATSEEEVREAIRFARGRGVPFFVLGGGSNIVVADEGYGGLVIKMEIKGVAYEEGITAASAAAVFVTAGAGESWDSLVADVVARSLWGLENLSAIPGTVGAAPVQNIGAYGSEAKDCIASVRTVHVDTGAARTFTNAECCFAYRDSFFKSPEGKKWIITSVTFSLSREPRPNISYKDLQEYFAGRDGATTTHVSAAPSLAEIREAVVAIRARKFPDLATVGTAGSFWKNPIISAARFAELARRFPGLPSFPAETGFVKIPLGWILDKVCNLKGHTRRPQNGPGVALFERQALVMVADRGATASHIKAFESEIRAIVREKTGIEIEPEVVFLGRFTA